ncbi:MAG: YkgJ family cysteine cluster protein [Haloarculaceae archaeon]
MEVDCEGCAGCCIDWRPLTDAPLDHERRGPHDPIDDTYNLAPLTRDEVRDAVADGWADALVGRLFRAGGDAEPDRRVTVDGTTLAAVDGRPVFAVGLRKVPKPVGPFGRPPAWLETCVFLDPTTLQCRIHGSDRYPETCRTYPGANLAVGVETECERVEAAWGGRRLLDDAAPEDARPLFGPAALGSKVFLHPDPDRLAGTVERLAAAAATPADRAEFVAVAAASSPGTASVDGDRYGRARRRARAADSWVGRAARAWERMAGSAGERAPASRLAAHVEDDAGAPGTPGWDLPDDGEEGG